MMQHNNNNYNSQRFFSTHNSCVRCVAFSPKDRYLFCSGGNDGQIAIYHAGRSELLSTHAVISSGLNRFVSAVGFSCDGQKILAAASSRRVSVIDAEHGTTISSYDNCSFSPNRDRTPLAMDPTSPFIAACSYVNGKGVAMLDLRMPLPLDFIFDFHTDTIRDITFLHESWPFIKPSSSSSLSLLDTKICCNHSNGYTLLTLSSQGVAKVTSLDGRLLHTFDYGHPANSIAVTPEHYGSTHDGFTSAWVCGGNIISSYVPNEETFRTQQQQSTEHHSSLSSLPSQIHFNPAYNPNISLINSSNNNSSDTIRRNNNPASVDGANNDGNGNRNSSSSASSSSRNNNSNQPWNPSFNVIISNPNNVNLNVYRIPRRNDLIFGNIDSVRITRAIRSLVASSQQLNNSNNNNNNSNASNNQALQSSSSSSATTNSSSSSIIAQLGSGHMIPASVSGAAATTAASASSDVNNPGSSRSSGSSSNAAVSGSSGSGAINLGNRISRSLIHHLPYQQMRLNVERNNNSIHIQRQNNDQNEDANNFLNDYNDDDDDDEDDDDDDDDDDANIINNNNSTDDDCMNPELLLLDHNYHSSLINRKIDQNTPVNSFIKKTLFYHDHWDRIPNVPDHPQQIWRLRFSSNGAHLYAAGEGGFLRAYRRFPNLIMCSVGELYRHRGDIIDMDISPYDEFLVTASKDKTVGLICLGKPSHGWTEYYEYA